VKVKLRSADLLHVGRGATGHSGAHPIVITTTIRHVFALAYDIPPIDVKP
jgi:hypothetical protein